MTPVGAIERQPVAVGIAHVSVGRCRIAFVGVAENHPQVLVVNNSHRVCERKINKSTRLGRADSIGLRIELGLWRCGASLIYGGGVCL